MTLSVLTWPALPSARPSRPSIENANAPASPTSTTASLTTTRESRSPACITRANTRLPSTVSETQHGPVGCSSSRIGPEETAGTGVDRPAGAPGCGNTAGDTGAAVAEATVGTRADAASDDGNAAGVADGRDRSVKYRIVTISGTLIATSFNSTDAMRCWLSNWLSCSGTC